MNILTGLNEGAFYYASKVASPFLTFVMQYWTESFYLVLIALVAYMYLKKDKNLVPFIFAGVLLYAISEIIKDIVKEPRPCAEGNFQWVQQVACESNYSFPSSHATVLTGLAIFLKNYKYIRIGYIVWLIVVLFSRIYLGEHYFTDVLAGAVISIVVAYTIYKYENWINRVADKMLSKLFGRKTNGN